MARRAVSQVIDWKASASQVQAQVIEFQAQVLPSSDKSKFNFLSFQSTSREYAVPPQTSPSLISWVFSLPSREYAEEGWESNHNTAIDTKREITSLHANPAPCFSLWEKSRRTVNPSWLPPAAFRQREVITPQKREKKWIFSHFCSVKIFF